MRLRNSKTKKTTKAASAEFGAQNFWEKNSSKVRELIRYELKLANTFVMRPFITQLDKTLVPVVIGIFSYDYKRKHQIQKNKN